EISELKKYFQIMYNNNFQLDDYVCELVKISALCHDIGHGPFSHAFDDLFKSNKYINHNDSGRNTHEFRSTVILEHIIKNDKILSSAITDDEIQFMKNLIDPKDRNGFIYQIVSNNLNGLDVDKFDYLQ